jgi:hypothetical protein
MPKRIERSSRAEPSPSVFNAEGPPSEWSTMGKKLWHARKKIEAAGEANLTHKEAMAKARLMRLGR